MKKIRIVHISKNLRINGISTVMLNYCKNIDKDKFDVSIIAAEPIDDKNREICKKNNINLITCPKKRNILKYIIFLCKNLNNKNFDIVHIHCNSATSVLELLIAKINKIKICATHSHNTKCNHIIIHKLLRPAMNKLSDLKYACGDAAGQWLYGNKEFKVIPNGFDTKEFIFNNDNRKKIRKQLGLENNLILGHVGRFTAQKNHEYLLRIFEKIAEHNDKAVLLLVGEGPRYKKIEGIVKNHKYHDRIIMYGPSNNVNELYDAMDIFVIPSKHEGLVVVLLEAQIKGLPCFASNKMSQEVAFSKDSVKFLSIDNEPSNWYDAIQSCEIEKDREKTYILNKDAIEKYNIYNTVHILEKDYMDIFNF